jgi:hypothetical protein
VSASLAYTYSHLIDDAGQTINAGGCVCQNPRKRGAAERASSVLDQRHRMVASYLWEIPFLKTGHGFTSVVAGGWSLGGIVTLASGFPINVTQSGDTWNADALWPRPNLVAGQTVKLSDPTPSLWFNTAAFSRSSTYGTAPRNPIFSPGTTQFDLSASKSFPIFGEDHKLMFRAEMFNAFNTPQFGSPGTTLGTATFGRVTSTANDNRQIQMALKYSF